MINKGMFKKGHTINNGRIPWNKNTKGVCKAWNKGKETPKIVKEKQRKAKLGITGEKTNHWKGGKVKMSGGYISVYIPNHPFANDDKYVSEHRLAMEKYLNRYLTKKEVVHHINNIRNDNRIENLMLFANNSEHRKFHWTQLHSASKS
jgi:hypothetical protein